MALFPETQDQHKKRSQLRKLLELHHSVHHSVPCIIWCQARFHAARSLHRMVPGTISCSEFSASFGAWHDFMQLASLGASFGARHDFMHYVLCIDWCLARFHAACITRCIIWCLAPFYAVHHSMQNAILCSLRFFENPLDRFADLIFFIGVQTQIPHRDKIYCNI